MFEDPHTTPNLAKQILIQAVIWTGILLDQNILFYFNQYAYIRQHDSKLIWFHFHVYDRHTVYTAHTHSVRDRYTQCTPHI